MLAGALVFGAERGVDVEAAVDTHCRADEPQLAMNEIFEEKDG